MLHFLPDFWHGLRGLNVCVIVVAGALLPVDIARAQAARDHVSPPSAAMLTQSTVAASPLPFESTLSRYKPMTDQKLGSWREANDAVTRIGGWRTYLKEAQEPDPKTVTPIAPVVPVRPVTPVPPNPHAGHGVKP
jgi:hypothetical protein